MLLPAAAREQFGFDLEVDLVDDVREIFLLAPFLLIVDALGCPTTSTST